ncbi:MAG: NAD(P)/FAD-dependent oxidoreductase [Synergistaceae bacterium]|jgi:sarcosine oxidase subunit alpha|nr:NAD(P)/FAD-dependent oxidoreductase [Synergistaceae bacterium]
MNPAVREAEILVVGGGAAGLCAAAEAAVAGARVLVLESDLHLGGQLVKQTHKFFGSKDEFAGTRGFKIAGKILDEMASCKDKIETVTNANVMGYYPEDGVVTVMVGEDEYFKVKPARIVMATGAQERLIAFPNNDLPGVYGAGAVQTLMNVYGVSPGDRVLMVGAGNIGLIVSYQLMQAGVQVAAILEAMPNIGGYWVHAAKIRRLGVPILLRHTIKAALGDVVVEGAIVRSLANGETFKIDCDIICLAVGLSPTAEILWQAGCEMKYVPELCGYVPIRNARQRTTNDDVWVAGDAAGIEEASSAMVEGRIAGLDAAASLGYEIDESRFGVYEERLKALRSGETASRIRAGLARVSANGFLGGMTSDGFQ